VLWYPWLEASKLSKVDDKRGKNSLNSFRY
jgi:hypothetical protein